MDTVASQEIATITKMKMEATADTAAMAEETGTLSTDEETVVTAVQMEATIVETEALMGVKVTIPTPHTPKTETVSTVANRPTVEEVAGIS